MGQVKIMPVVKLVCLECASGKELLAQNPQTRAGVIESPHRLEGNTSQIRNTIHNNMDLYKKSRMAVPRPKKESRPEENPSILLYEPESKICLRFRRLEPVESRST
jgi:hypothetical protein